MKLNRGGLTLSGLYTGFVIVMVWLAYSADPKGSFFFGFLAMFPGALLIACTGLDYFISVDSWLNTAFFLFPLSLLIVYFVGWIFSLIINVKDPSLPVSDDPPDWHKR